MYNFKNKNLYSNDILNPDKNQRYYYDFGTGNKIERKEVKKARDAFLEAVNKTSTKPQNQKKDDFLEGFNDPYGERREQERQKKEQERKEMFANIRANADKRTWSSQSILSSQTDPFLEGFNQDKKEEKKWTGNLFKKKTNNILSPKLPNNTDHSFLSDFVGEQDEKLNNEYRTIRTYDPNKESVITQFSNDKTKQENTNVFGAVFPFVSPEFHKKVWDWGADNYLTKNGYHTSAWLLKHSLQPNPEDVYRDDNSRIAQLIKNDPAFLKELDIAIAKSDGKTLDDTIYVPFEQGDLYYSIHENKIKLTGHKDDNGKWKISAKLKDVYDFSKLMTGRGNNGINLGTLANDAAYFSEDIGAITPYHIYVDFNVER